MVGLKDKLSKTDKVVALVRYDDGISLWTTLTESELEGIRKTGQPKIIELEMLKDDFS